MADEKPIGRGWAETLPDYRHAPVASVPLEFPFRLMGLAIDRLDLSPPSYGDLLRLRASGDLSAHAIVAALIGAPPVVIQALRWPDMEAVLAAGLPLLPPDLASRMSGGEEEAGGGDQEKPDRDRKETVAAPPAEEGTPTEPPAVADVGAELGIERPEPGEFLTEV
jgi:hypothetical protein